MRLSSVSLCRIYYRLKFSSENSLSSKNVYDELKVHSEALCAFDFEKKDCYTYANRKWQVEYPFVTCDNEGGACQVCQIAHRCENRYNRALEAVISPAYASKDYMRDRDNKRISYRGSHHHGCQCTSGRGRRHCFSPRASSYRALKYSPRYTHTHAHIFRFVKKKLCKLKEIDEILFCKLTSQMIYRCFAKFRKDL